MNRTENNWLVRHWRTDNGMLSFDRRGERHVWAPDKIKDYYGREYKLMPDGSLRVAKN